MASELHIRIVARRLLRELELHRLLVRVVTKPVPGKPLRGLREAISQNPEWYRELCRARASEAHPRKKRHDTAIKRAHVISGLQAIESGRVGKYHDLLRPLCERMANQGNYP